jgi:serine/threonine-protein kinase
VLDLSGANLEGYRLEDRLGSSSHTAVYRATASAGIELAVKVVDAQLEPEDSLFRRLRREAGVLTNVHPDILPIHEAGRWGQLTFAAVPLVRARTLQQLLSEGRLENEMAWKILSQIADALDSVHYRGLAFRLLKPANILVDERGRVFLAEFGITSRRVGPLAISTPRYNLSAPQYLAPEQVEGREPDWRADIYAMAVLIFEILTSTPLQEQGPTSDILRDTLRAPVRSAHAREPALPRAVDRVLGRAMARDPLERHHSAWELLEELVTLPDDQPIAVSGQSRTGAPAAAAADASVPVAKAPPGSDSMVTVMRRVMGVPVFRARRATLLNSYFAALVRFAREASEMRWPEVVEAAGLQEYLELDPPDDPERTASLESASRLADAIDGVFGEGAPEVLREWSRLTTSFWIQKTQQLQEGGVTYLRPLRLRASPELKVEDTLYIFSRNIDRIRGERLSAWKKVDKGQFWLLLYDNLLVVGRPRPAKSCHFWTAALESALRWGGLANDWIAQEAECGCATGTFDCVFTVQRVKR